MFTEDFSPAKLISKVPVNGSGDAIIATFALPDETKPLGLSTCACLLARGGKDKEGNPVVRPYTPINTNALVGKMEFLIRVYPDGAFSQHLNNLPLGETVDFKHISFNVKIQYDQFKAKKEIGMICGGTGVTPMIQALHAILGTEGDGPKVSMLYGSRNSSDILAGEAVDAWAKSSQGRFKVIHGKRTRRGQGERGPQSCCAGA